MITKCDNSRIWKIWKIWGGGKGAPSSTSRFGRRLTFKPSIRARAGGSQGEGSELADSVDARGQRQVWG